MDLTKVDLGHEISKLVQDLNLSVEAQEAEHEEIRDEIKHAIGGVKSVVDDNLDVMKKQLLTKISSLKTHFENASKDELSKLTKEFEKQRKKDIGKLVFALILVLIVILFNKTN